MFLAIFGGSQLRASAKDLIMDFLAACPPPTEGCRPISERVIGKSLDEMYSRIAAFIIEKRLGLVGRARLAKAIQDEMYAAGYPDDMVTKIVNAVAANALVQPQTRR